MFKGNVASIVIGIVALIFAGVPVWDILDRRGISGAAFALIVWVIALGVIAYTAYRNLKDSHRANQLRSEIVTIKDEHNIHLKAIEKRLEEETEKAKTYFHDYNEEVQSHQETKAKEREANTYREQTLREVERLKAELAAGVPPMAGIDDAKATLVRNAPRLWVEYRSATKNPPNMEVLIFSKDGNSAIRNIEVGPLVWNFTETRPISLHNVIGVLRSDPIECKFTAYEQDGKMQRVYELAELMREMMKRFGVAAQPSVEVLYADMEENGFSQTFVLSIDPYNRIVWEPQGSLRAR